MFLSNVYDDKNDSMKAIWRREDVVDEKFGMPSS